MTRLRRVRDRDASCLGDGAHRARQRADAVAQTRPINRVVTAAWPRNLRGFTTRR